MRKVIIIFSYLVVISVVMVLLSACGSGVTRQPESLNQEKQGYPLGETVVATEISNASVAGLIDEINADVWLVNGQTVYVDPGILGDDTFEVGDEVNIQGTLNPDNTVTAITVELVKAGNPS
jgi:hypothetical protein